MKIKKIEPQQLVDKNIGYKEYRKILKPALKRMLGEHNTVETKTDFIVKTNFEYSDLKGKKMGLIILGDHTSGWIKTVRDQVKEDKKNSLYGSCYTNKKADGTYALVLFPEKGSPKKNLMIKQLEKFALKGTPFKIEIASGGELEEDNEAEAIVEDVALPDDSNDEEEADNDAATGELLVMPEKVKLAAEHLKRGTLEADAEKKAQVITFLEKSLEAFYNKYLDLHPDDKNLNKTTEGEYIIIRKLINADKYRKPVMAVADLKTLAGGSSWGFKKTNYDQILDVLDQYQKAADHKVKHSKVLEINILIAEWEKSHPAGKRNKDEEKRYNGLMQLKNNIAPFIGVVKDASIKDFDANSLNDDTTLFKETSGTAMASERAKQIAEATVDDRAIELARLLQLGKASDNDANFGAVMKWLTDSMDKDLSAKYKAAAKKIFGKEGVLISDITKIFGVSSLRSKYLLELYAGKVSPYAPTAVALGILGKAWFSSEANDAFEFIEKNLNSDQIAVLLKKETQEQQGTFEGAIAKKLNGNEKYKAQLTSFKLLKSAAKDKEAIKAELTANNIKIKYDYVSAADYFLCSTFERIDDADKFAKELKNWVKKSSDEERKAIQGKSAFYQLLEDKISRIPGRGISKSTVSYLKSIISTYQIPPSGQESGKVVEQLQQIAARQKEKNAISRWKQDKAVGDEFKKVLFSEDVESPQEALIYKFCSADDIKKWENAAPDDKKAILEKAVDELKLIMAAADIHADKVDEILETVYSDGARGEVYNKLKDIIKAKTKIGASGNVMEALEDLAPDSKEIVGIKNDIELLKALKVKALQGTFKTEEDRERWRTAMKKLGIPPADSEITAAETAKNAAMAKLQGVHGPEDIKAAADANERHQLLVDLKEIADPSKIVDEAIADKVKEEFKRPPGLPRRNKILTKEQIEAQQKKETDLKKTPGYWAAKLAAEYKKGFTGRDDHRLVQLAYESKQQGVSGADIMKDLIKLSPNLHATITEPSTFDFGDSASILKAILIDGRTVSLTEMLNHAKKDAVFQRRVRVEDLKVMTENVDEKTIISEWFDVDALKVNIAKKKELVDEAEALKNKIDKTADDKKRLKQLDAEMAKANNALMRFDIKNDLLKSLEDSAKADKVLEFKKYLREKICDAIQDEKKGKELQNSLKEAGIDISDSDFAIIAASLKEISNLEYEASIETGLQWSSLSSRMLQRDLAASQQLREGWKGREKLQQITKLSKNELQAEEQGFVDRMKQVDEELVLAQEKFVESKNKYDGRLKTFISIVVNALIATATALSGVGSAAVLIQLAWAIGTTALSTAINQGIEKLVKGKNYGGAEEFVVQLLANEVGAVLTFAGGQVLDAMPLGDVLDQFEKGITNEDKIAEIFTGPLKDTLKDIPKDIIKKYTENVVKSFHEKGSIIDNTLNDLEDYTKGLITDFPLSYFKSVLGNATELGLSEAAKKFFGGNGEGFFSYDDKWGEKVDEDGNQLPNTLDMITDKSLVDNFVENFKNPKVMINLANSFIRGEDGNEVNFMEMLIERSVDAVVEKIVGNLDEEEAEKVDADALKEQIKKNLEEANAKFKEEVIANLGSLPVAESVEASAVQKMSLPQLKKLYNRFIKIHAESDILTHIKSRFKVSAETWEAFKKSFNIRAEKSLDSFLNDFSEVFKYLKDKKFAADIISGQIEKEYTIPADTHSNSPERKETIPSDISIKDKFDKWKLIMEASRFAIL